MRNRTGFSSVVASIANRSLSTSAKNFDFPLSSESTIDNTAGSGKQPIMANIWPPLHSENASVRPIQTALIGPQRVHRGN